MVKLVAGGLVVFCSLAACQRTEPAVAPATNAPTPVVAETAPVSSVAPSSAPAPARGAAESPLTLRLSEHTFKSGSLLTQPIPTTNATRGGHESRNRIGDELRALAEQCRCTGQPIALSVDESVLGYQLLSVLGLLRVAGFSQVQVERHAEVLRFEIAGSGPTGSPTLRILDHDAFLGVARADSKTDAVTQLCGSTACEGATLSVSASADLEVWWHAARVLAGAQRARPVRIELDSQPRPVVAGEPTIPLEGLGSIAHSSVQQRVVADYAALYSCLVEFPLPANSSAAIEFDLSIDTNGVPQGVTPVSKLPPSETTACVASAFKAMVFHTGKARPGKVRYPLVREDQQASLAVCAFTSGPCELPTPNADPPAPKRP